MSSYYRDGKYKFRMKNPPAAGRRDAETNLDYFGARYYNSELGRWYSADPAYAKYPGWSLYNYCMDNPVIYIDTLGKDIAFFVDKYGAGGNGHTTLYFQDGKGQWYSYNQGATQMPSGGMVALLLGANTSAGVDIQKVDGVPQESLKLETSSEQDEKISKSAYDSQEEHNSGAGVKIENPSTIIKPNTWFNYLKSVKIIHSTYGNDVDNTATKIEWPKYEEVQSLYRLYCDICSFRAKLS